MKGHICLSCALPLGDDVAGFLVDRGDEAVSNGDPNGGAVEALGHRPTGPECVRVISRAVAFADQITIFGDQDCLHSPIRENVVNHAIDSGLTGADLLGECGGKVPGRFKDRGCIILCFG